MQAVTYTQYGGPEVTKLSTQPKSVAGKDDVLVKVCAGGLNPVDALQRKGDFKMIMPYQLPVVAGNEFSGTITEVGSNVSTFKVGDKVICRVPKHRLGGLGEFVAVPAAVVANAPKSISLADAAGLPLAGLTALQTLDVLDVKAGDKILITGGAGGVGQLAIQLAKLRGAHVTTTASQAGRSFVLEAGADEVIDYKTQKLAEWPLKFSKVLDLVGGDGLKNEVLPATANGGRLISVSGPPTPGTFDQQLGWKASIFNVVLYFMSRSLRSAASSRQIDYSFYFMKPDAPGLRNLADLIDQKKLKLNVEKRFPMKDYSRAFKALESGRSKGKIVVVIDEAQ